MTLQTFTASYNNSNATTFKAWGQAVSNALGACPALARTADTGQLDWTTNPAVPSSNAAAGYEMYRFTDALQASAPIYVKFEYGTGSSSTQAVMWYTIGTGTDGAGTITGTFFPAVPAAGQIIPRQTMWTSSTGTVPPGTTSYLVSDANGFAFFFGPSFSAGSSTGALFLLERTRTFTGTATADGYLHINNFQSGSSGMFNSCNPVSFIANNYTFTQGQSVKAWNPGNTSGQSAGTLTVGGTVYAQPVFTGFNVRLGGPSQFVMAVPSGDLGGGVTVSFPHYGTSHSWLAAGLGVPSATPPFWGPWPGVCTSFLFRMD